MVVDSLVYHPAVTHYNKFVATTVGRDKALRTIQYFSRFLAWYLTRSPTTTTSTPAAASAAPSATTAATLTLLKSNLGLVRKCLRIGKFIEHFRAAATAFDASNNNNAQKTDNVVRYLAVGRQLGYGMYLGLDALTYLDAAGIKRSEFAKRCQREAYKAWVLGLACSALSGVYSLWVLNGRMVSATATATGKKSVGGGSDVEDKVEGKKIARERSAVQVQLVSDVCDLTIPSTALGYVSLSEGVVGLAGTVSSLIGLNAQWAKTA